MTDKRLLALILQIPEESQTVEFKRLGSASCVKKVVETIVAMTNTDGGQIILGVDDPEKSIQSGVDRVYGIEESTTVYDEILQKLRDIIPPISGLLHPKEMKVIAVNKTIAILYIPKAVEGFHSIDNAVYIRLKKSNKRLTPQEHIKMSYAKGFTKADKELVEVDFDLLDSSWYREWRDNRHIAGKDIKDVLHKTGLARKQKGQLLPTRAAVLLFADFPTNLMDTKCAIRILQFTGTFETYRETPNMVGAPLTVDGPLMKLIPAAHEKVLNLLRTGIELKTGFITKYRIPERVLREAITNAVIHRDYHIKRDIEVKIFEDRVEVNSPGLLPYNITSKNIGKVRSEGYRNDLLVKHLREFPAPPNLDQNEGVKAMQNEMKANNLFPPTYWTYPFYIDSVEVGLFNEHRSTEWDKIKEYLIEHKYINNSKAREITGIVQLHVMSRLLTKWTDRHLLTKIQPSSGSTRLTKYKLSNQDDLDDIS